MPKKTIEEIKSLLDARRYKPEFIPPKESVILKIQEKHTIATLQNFAILSGLPKSCKSTFVSAMLGAAISKSPVFDMEVNLPDDRQKIAYFDTESSDYDFYRQVQRVETFANRKITENLIMFQVREDAPSIIRAMIEIMLKDDKTISFIIIDGLLDLCLNYNDETETRLLVNWLKKITKEFNILILAVLHLGKKDEQTLGHLGSNTDRWAQSTLKVVKDKENNLYSLEPKFLRSSEDFQPIKIKNINGIWSQIDEDIKHNNNFPDEMTHIEKLNLIHRAIKRPMSYKDLVESFMANTGKGTNYCKKLIKEMILDNLIEKTEKGYADKNFF